MMGGNPSALLQSNTNSLYNAVMVRATTVGSLVELTEEQWGLFTRRQAEAIGMAWTTLSRLSRTGWAERVAHGVYRLRGAPPVDHLVLRSAWLQLAPEVDVWVRTLDQGVVSHRSAAEIYGLGHLTADVHEFTLPSRKQSRRPDVRLHRARLMESECANVGGLLVTRPARTAADLLADREAPDAVAQVIADSIRSGSGNPGDIAQAISPSAARFGLREGDGLDLLDLLLDLTGDPGRASWLDQARRQAR